MFGTVIDQSCILWQEKRCTGAQGNCWVYSADQMALNVLIVSVCCKVASMIFFSTACYLYKPPPADKPKDDGDINQAYVGEDDENDKL